MSNTSKLLAAAAFAGLVLTAPAQAQLLGGALGGSGGIGGTLGGATGSIGGSGGLTGGVDRPGLTREVGSTTSRTTGAVRDRVGAVGEDASDRVRRAKRKVHSVQAPNVQGATHEAVSGALASDPIGDLAVGADAGAEGSAAASKRGATADGGGHANASAGAHGKNASIGAQGSAGGSATR